MIISKENSIEFLAGIPGISESILKRSQELLLRDFSENDLFLFPFIQLMHESPQAEFILLNDARLLFNDALAKFLNGAVEAEIILEKNFSTMKDHFQKANKGQSVILTDVDWKIGERPNSMRVNISLIPIRSQNGNVLGVNGRIEDKTFVYTEIENLKAAEEQFRAMADNIPNLAWMAHADGWIFWYNKKWYEYTGTTPKEMEGWGWQSVHDPVELPKVVQRWQESINQGKPFDMIFPLKGADGKFRQFLTRVLPYHDEKGKIILWFGTNTDITERVESEMAIKESEERFRTMAEGTEIMIAVSDETSKATYFNKAWEDMTGRSQEDLIDFGWADLIHPEERERILNTYLEAFKAQVPWVMEFRMLDKHGKYRWLLANGPVRYKPDGTFAGYISSSIDITLRKEAESKLRESEQKLRSIVENAPFPIGVYIGREMRIELANESILKVWGKGMDMVGRLYSEILPELEDQSIFQQLDQVYVTGQPFHAFNQQIDLNINGELKTFYFNYSFTPLTDSSGKVYGVMNTAADVTDLNLAKQKVEQSERNLRSMILQAPVAMCILRGDDFVVEVANELMAETLGKTSFEIIGKPLFTGVPEARDQGLEQMLQNVYRFGQTYKANERPVNLLRNGKKETVYQNFVYEPYRDGDGTILGVLVVTIDVTDQVLARKEIEKIVSDRTKELADTNRDLQRSNAELAQFAYIASHDLQEPLRKISTFSQMLERSLGERLDEKSGELLKKINSSSARMNTLIRDVLTFSELVKDGNLFKKVDLNEVLKNTISDYDLLIEQKGAKIEIEQLPVLEAIPLQMSQLFGNLMGNALKFSRKDLQPHISISVHQPDKEEWTGQEGQEFVKIVFRDNGIGFKKEYARQIFNIFQRLHRKSEYEGTGIGLAMCRKIALNHNGDINAEGSSEDGAVFNIYLPLRQPEKE